MDFEHRHFDEKIKAILGDLTPSYDPTTWEQLDQRLTAEAILNPDDVDDIDDIVAKGLASLSVPLAAANWDSFEEKLDASELAEASDTSIDNLTYEKLHDYKVSYNSSHWLLMAERLEEAFSLRRKLYRYKVAEIALMLLFLITLVNYLPLGKKLSNSVIPFKQKKEKQQAAPSPENQTIKTIPLESAPIAKNQEETNNSLPVQQGIALNKQTVSASKKAITTPIDILSNKTDLKESVIEAPNKLPSQSIDEISNDFASSIAKIDILRPSLNEGGTFISGKNINRNTVLLAKIDNPDIKLLENGKFKLPALATFLKKKKGTFRYNIFAATDANYIYEPYIELLNYGQATRAGALGYGGGMTAAYKKGRWQIELGGIYTFKRYNPNIGTNIFFIKKDSDIEVKEDLKAIQLDLLQVPLNFQYYFLNRNKWRMYSTAGLTLNMVTTAVYEIETSEKVLLAPAPPGGGGPDKSLRNSEEFNKGILDGGKFAENQFLSASLGFGVERSISARWSLFFQPNYQQYLSKKGLGPNRVKINSMSFYLGTRVNIK